MKKHIYTARAFDKNDVYVCHQRKIEGKKELIAYKREARRQHTNIAYWRIFNETLDRTVHKTTWRGSHETDRYLP